MGNANKNAGKTSRDAAKAGGDAAKESSGAGKPSGSFPYIAAAAIVVIAIALIFFLVPIVQQQIKNNPPLGQGPLPPVSNLMKPESCQFVYGVVMDGACTGGLYQLAEVESNSGTKKFCCGKSVNLENEAKEPLPITPPAGYVPPSNATPEVAVQNISANGSVQPAPGSDRDVYGCIPSAGYTWCAAKQKCIRPFEETCAPENVGINATNPPASPPPAPA